MPSTSSAQLTPSNSEALRYILDAWQEAVYDGIAPDMMADAALFAALTDLVSTYGEDAVVDLTNHLARRIERGEFTIYRTTQ